MTFFPEIDEKATIKNAKRKLREYPRWRRVANDVNGQKVTQTYSFELRNPSGSPSRPVENLAIRKVDALAELDAIEYAVNCLLNPNHRRILYEKFLKDHRSYDFEIYSGMYLSETSFYIELGEALTAFAEQYRSGCLIVKK